MYFHHFRELQFNSVALDGHVLLQSVISSLLFYFGTGRALPTEPSFSLPPRYYQNSFLRNIVVLPPRYYQTSLSPSLMLRDESSTFSTLLSFLFLFFLVPNFVIKLCLTFKVSGMPFAAVIFQPGRSSLTLLRYLAFLVLLPSVLPVSNLSWFRVRLHICFVSIFRGVSTYPPLRMTLFLCLFQCLCVSFVFAMYSITFSFDNRFLLFSSLSPTPFPSTFLRRHLLNLVPSQL